MSTVKQDAAERKELKEDFCTLAEAAAFLNRAEDDILGRIYYEDPDVNDVHVGIFRGEFILQATYLDELFEGEDPECREHNIQGWRGVIAEASQGQNQPWAVREMLDELQDLKRRVQCINALCQHQFGVDDAELALTMIETIGDMSETLIEKTEAVIRKFS